MKKPTVTVSLVFAGGGPALRELVAAAFRLWLQEQLDAPAPPSGAAFDR